ncbi:hypothetical protein NL676_012434 [Syzygium grande]|nr:hypothetical protein NL676_012434 [Syzygium grande]
MEQCVTLSICLDLCPVQQPYSSVSGHLQGTDQIEALHLDYSESLSKPYCLTNELFRKLPNLRYLRAHNAEVTGDFKDLRKLRWLDWMACETSFSPANFPPENLIILNVRVGGLREHCDTWHHVNGLEKLKVLRLLHCYNLIETPDFSTLQNLEILNLEYCVNLVKIHPSIRNTRNLISLSLTDCEKLKELPKEMGCLTNLTELLIDGSSIQEIPVYIGRMRKLEIFSARNCRSLVQIDSSIGSLRKLHSLSLDGCRSLSTLPDSIGKLKSLTQLSLSESGVKELPHSIGDLHNLKVLLMARSFLRSLPRTMGRLKKLEELDASGCKYLQGEIPSEIRDIQALREFSSCKILYIEECKSIVNLPDLSEFEDLENLTVKKCRQLADVPGLDGARSLKFINISGCEMLENLPDLSGLELLEELKVRHCGKITELQGLGGLRSLSFVDFSGCNLLKPPGTA